MRPVNFVDVHIFHSIIIFVIRKKVAGLNEFSQKFTKNIQYFVEFKAKYSSQFHLFSELLHLAHIRLNQTQNLWINIDSWKYQPKTLGLLRVKLHQYV